MATIRVGVGSFNIEDKGVGFGTSPTDGLGNLRVKGVTKTTGSIVSGASTLTRYSGFAADNINQLENITLTSEVGTIGDIVVGVGTSVIISSGSTVTVGTVESVSIGTHFSPPKGGIEERGDNFLEGMMRFNTDLNTMEFYNGNEWRQFTYISDIQNSPGSRGRGVFGGGYGSSRTSQIRHVNIMSQGNAITGGDLLSATTRVEACGNAVRSVWGGGYAPSHVNVIQYRAAASDGDTVDFGDLVTARSSHFSACSSTRGTWGGGYNPGHINSINYIEIMTTGDALDFGDIGVSGPGQINATQSPTRAVLGGGTPGNGDGKMTTFNFSSKGNSVFFGNLTQSRRDYGGGGNSIRGVFCGGADANPSSIIDFITIASDGNATFFGDLTQEKRGTNCCDSQTRTVIVGSSTSPGRTNVIDFLNIASAGNAQDFGDDVDIFNNIGTTSDSHGGLGGY